MKTKKTLCLIFLLVAGTLTACTRENPCQPTSSAVHTAADAVSAVSGPPQSSAVADSSGLKKEISSQNSELQDILNNLNGIGDSAAGLDKATSSDLAVPEN